VGLTKIGPKHQITIPKDAIDALRLTPGDMLEGRVEKGQTGTRTKEAGKDGEDYAGPRTKAACAGQAKIERIRLDPASARGLSPEEGDAASRAGLHSLRPALVVDRGLAARRAPG